MSSRRTNRRSPLRPLEPLEAREVPAAGLLADLNAVGSPAFAPGYPFSPPVSAVAGGSAYFFGTDGTHATALFKSDGTAAGTKLVRDMTVAGATNPLGPPVMYPPGVSPQAMVAAGGKVYFAWDDGAAGSELWVSDGTAGGTKLVKDLVAGRAGSYPVPVGEAGGRLVFTVDMTGNPGWGTSATALYATDGTPGGTVELASFPGGVPGRGFTAANGTVYFARTDWPAGHPTSVVWSTDGTAAGTREVVRLPDGTTVVAPEAPFGTNSPGFAVAGNTLYFAATDNATGAELWVADSTGARMVEDANTGTYPIVTPIESGMPWLYYGYGSNPRQLTVAGSSVFFVADDGPHGDQLWVSNGTAAGTRMVKDLGQAGASVPGLYSGARVTGLTAAGGKVYFAADDGTTGPQAYVSDGTAAGTLRLTTVAHTPPPADPSTPVLSTPEEPVFLAAAGGRVVFTIGDAVNGRQLWATDGTAAGTGVVRTFPKGTPADAMTGWLSAGPLGVAALGGKLLFNADDGTTGRQLWATDGTAAGTALVKRINTDTQSSDPRGFITAGGKAYFVASDGRGPGVFVSDGRSATLLKRFGDVYQGPASWTGPITEAPAQLVGSGGKVYFVVRAGSYGRQLWATDGTAAGTSAVKTLPSTVSGYSFSGQVTGIDNLTDVGGVVYFTVDAKGEGQSLWRTDGTAAGTRLVKQTNTAAVADDASTGLPWMGGLGAPRELTAVGTRVFFVANDGTGEALWVSDGTAAGTKRARDLTPSGGPSPADLTALNGKVYFTAAPAGVHELWVSDGTANGTSRVAVLGTNPPGGLYSPTGPRRMTAAGGRLFIASGDGVWVSDGTAAGTTSLTTPTATPAPDPFAAGATQLTAVGSKVFFVRSDGTNGRQLWVTDGTAAGTKLARVVGGVKLVTMPVGGPYPTDANPVILTSAGGRVLFAADDGTHGRELWASDGTAAGTKLVGEFAPGATDGLPADYINASSAVVVGDKLLLAGTDATRGTEPWTVATADFLPAVPPAPPPVTPTPTPTPITGKATVTRTVAVSATEGAAFSGTLATVRLPAGPAYKAWVFWGNGRTAEATITRVGTTGDTFNLAAGHTYDAAGNYAVMIRVTANTKTVLSIDTTATVADAKWYAGRVAQRVAAGQQFSGVVATIQDLNPLGGKATDYTATIDWGDGRTSAGTVRRTAAGRFEVVGSHTFAAAGKPTVTVTIKSVATGKTAAAASLFIIDPARLPLPGR